MLKNKKRFIYMLLAGLLIAILILNLMPHDPNSDHNQIYDYFISIVITFMVWEGNLRIDEKLNQRIPWITRPGYRLLVQFVISLVFSAAGVYLPMKIFNTFVCIIPPEREMILNYMSLGVGLIVSVIILTLEISGQFFRNWKDSLVQIEHYKTENMRAQLLNLKNQINPHFLFNNMSVLSSLVYKDQDKALDFINQLSKVYRYLLENHNNELVDLKTELEFVDAYIFLLQIRFDKNIQFEINISEDWYSLLLPPMSLQMLIENAIKHNVVSEESPLSIKLSVEENKLVVCNSIHLRTIVEESTKTGLKNIKDRYRFFSEEEPEIIETKDVFQVNLPLLKVR
jgi:sensor histidine kinase YesM